MAGLESLRTPDEVAELRGLSVNRVLGLAPKAESSGAETVGASPNGHQDRAPDASPPEKGFEVPETGAEPESAASGSTAEEPAS